MYVFSKKWAACNFVNVCMYVYGTPYLSVRWLCPEHQARFWTLLSLEWSLSTCEESRCSASSHRVCAADHWRFCVHYTKDNEDFKYNFCIYVVYVCMYEHDLTVSLEEGRLGGPPTWAPPILYPTGKLLCLFRCQQFWNPLFLHTVIAVNKYIF